jgi:hypothetical protein
MSFDFPSNPTFNQEYTKHGCRYQWNGYGWTFLLTDEGFSPFEQEYTLPGDVLVPIPVGATKVTMEAIGAGGPGCIGGTATIFDEREYWEGIWTVPIPAGATRVEVECISSGGGGSGLGGGGGAYAKRNYILTNKITPLKLTIPGPSGGNVGGIMCSVLQGDNIVCYAPGGEAGSNGGGGGPGIGGYGDVKYGGGAGAAGAGGSAAWEGGPGNPASGGIGGASPGYPAGAGNTNGDGAAAGGGGGQYGAGGGGWVRLRWFGGTTTRVRQEFTPESLAAAYESIPIPEELQEWEPGLGNSAFLVPVPLPARGQLMFVEAIGSGGPGQDGVGGGGGAYANTVHDLQAGEVELIIDVPAAPTVQTEEHGTTGDAYVLIRGTNERVVWAGGGNHRGEPGAPGVAVFSDVERDGGAGAPNGGGGSAACKTAAANSGTASAGGASPGLPAGKGGNPGLVGQAKGGGGGVGATGSIGWVAIEWNYAATEDTPGGGGGGGAFARKIDLAVAGLTGLYLTVPPPPSANTRVNADPAIVRQNDNTGTILCQAAGGNHGISLGEGDGLGGQVANCVGDLNYAGGTGAFSDTTGGGGGAAGSISGNGSNAAGGTGGPTIGYPAGSGGSSGQVGGNYGGGGGSDRAGGGGYIKLSWS